jgi:hypothetical protein
MNEVTMATVKKMQYEVTLGMIKNMQHCVGFSKSEVTGTKHRIMHCYRNYLHTHGSHDGWNKLVELEYATKSDRVDGNGNVAFSLTKKGFKFLSDLCGFLKIYEIY